MKTVWLVRENADSMEGKGPMVPKFACLDKEDAKTYVSARPGIGGKTTTWKTYGAVEYFGDYTIEPFPLCESHGDIVQLPIQMARAAALAKLTAAERKLLGLE